MSTYNGYNGHKNYNHWNVSLWLTNTESLYSLAGWHVRDCRTRDEAAAMLLHDLCHGGAGVRLRDGVPYTPDGVRYTKTTIRAALVGW